jgi:hypothetical protein
MMNKKQLLECAREVEVQGQNSVAAYEQALAEQKTQLSESEYTALLGYLLILGNGGQIDDQAIEKETPL